MRRRKTPEKGEKKCRRCERYLKEKDFKSLISGKVIGLCQRCQRYIVRYNEMVKQKKLSYLARTFMKNKVTFKENEPYCMRCGKPLNYTVDSSALTNISKVVKRIKPLIWWYWKGFILCDSCRTAKLNGKKFNLYKNDTVKGKIKSILIRKQTGIEDLTEEERKFLFSDYPFYKLKQKYNGS